MVGTGKESHNAAGESLDMMPIFLDFSRFLLYILCSIMNPGRSIISLIVG